MNQNQLTKFKNRLLNIQTQLQSGINLLGRSTTEQLVSAKLSTALKIIRESYDLTDGIETHETTSAENDRLRRRKESKYTDLTPNNVIIRRNEAPTYNLKCRNYGEVRYQNGKVERTCIVGMDMCYCSKNCAYATNNVCSLKG